MRSCNCAFTTLGASQPNSLTSCGQTHAQYATLVLLLYRLLASLRGLFVPRGWLQDIGIVPRFVFAKNGGGGYRSPCLMHAKQALCHLSYTPDPSNPKSVYRSTTWPEHQCRPHAVACVCVCRGASGDGHRYAGPCCTQAHTQTRTVRGCPRALEFPSKYDAHRGARTHDHKIKSLALCQLS